MKLLTSVFIFLAFASQLLASCSGGHCKNVRVTRIYVTLDGITRISTNGDEKKLSCNAENGIYIHVDPQAKNYDSTFKLLLNAHNTKHPVWIRVNESGTCKLLYVVSDK